MGNTEICPLFGQFHRMATDMPARLCYSCEHEVITPRMLRIVEDVVRGIEGIEFVISPSSPDVSFALILSNRDIDPNEMHLIFVNALTERTRFMTRDEISSAQTFDTSFLDTALAVNAAATSHEPKS